MLTAQDEYGRRLILQREHTADDLKKQRVTHQYSCEVCHAPVILKIGQHITPHFAHKPGVHCEGDNEPESPAHREGKWSLFQWLHQQGESPVLEQYFPAIMQRADIGLPTRQWVIEYQCSPLSDARFQERTKGYVRESLQPIWILGANRLEQFGTHIYKWKQTDHLMLRKYKNSPYTIFFDGKTNTITFLSHFWSLSSNAIMADLYATTLSELTIEQLLNPPIPKMNSDKRQLAWLKQKEKWRTMRNLHQGKLELYVHTICQRLNLSFSFFPPYIGLPIPDDLVIASPAYLWQAWLVLHFLYQHPCGTTFHLKTIQKAFQRLVDKKIMVLRSGHGQFTNSITQYLKALERFSVIKKGKNNLYSIEKPVVWQPKSLSELRHVDAAALWRWLELDF